MAKSAKKSASDLLYIPSGFLYRSNLKPTKRDILCFAPFAGKEMTREQLEVGVSNILRSNGYQPNMAKMLIGQYENNYGAIFIINEPVTSVASSKLSNVSFQGV
jgi:hypothetical protein